jgi:hypothetical protein
MRNTPWAHAFPAALSAIALLTIFGTTSLISPPAAKAVKPCPDVLFLGARGSGEAGLAKESNMGAPVDQMASYIQGYVEALGETFEARGINYEAASVDLLKPSNPEFAALQASNWTGGASAVAAVGLWIQRHLRPYLASIDEGIAATTSAVRRATDRCPETELVLAGYSQGAMAVHQAELRLDDESLAAIGGTLLLGDGDRVPGTDAKLIGGAPRSGRGVRTYAHLLKHPQDVAEPETTVEICVTADIVCDFSLRSAPSWSHSTDIHTSFHDHPKSKAELRLAANWLAREMGLID